VIDKLKKIGFRGILKENIKMDKFTSLKIGGNCKLMAEPYDPYSLKVLIKVLKEEGINTVILGGGTNLLVSDEGIDTVVVTLKRWKGIEIIKDSTDEQTLFVYAGTPLRKFVDFSCKKGLTGIEGLVGIGGTVGGAIVCNTGAYGYEILNTIEKVITMVETKIKVITKETLNPSYRESGLEKIFNNSFCIVAAIFKLYKDNPEKVKKRMIEFFKNKKSTQPINERSAGCVFKNPNGYYAGKLIEEAGFKGVKVGGIEVSKKHANFFINTGAGKAKEFLYLMKIVQEEVWKKFSIKLSPEIKMIGIKW